MKKLTKFLKNNIISGFLVFLPIGIIIFVFKFAYNSIYNLVLPLATTISKTSKIQTSFSVIITITLILAVCLIIGIIVQTSIGEIFRERIENRILKKIPGYNVVNETIKQIFQGEETPFSKVALADVYSKGAYSTCFITDETDNMVTVFVPAALNPTSGNIFHLPKDRVTILDVSIDDAMRSIIGCGIGSDKLIKEFEKNKIEYKERI
ncbi:DUF502 domain-containing protein [Haliovirga abyssi]|uniref:Membrane protein n=1 Tax=Haliovirga abyssi TaxID=2996794 RepID=A0AAU9DD52_9FUSO|nr:DUF502 domain-containing protein [Haliovirga abyssi]BDU50093.1 membrane protein [Haliovirga abyssi]